MPLGSSYKWKEVWGPVVDRMRKRLAGWKTQHLSKEGRLTLIKASLASSPTQYLSLFVDLKSVYNTIGQI